ncbi:hypothetical protein RFI_11644, partial [Reticulomyxa filosa]
MGAFTLEEKKGQDDEEEIVHVLKGKTSSCKVPWIVWALAYVITAMVGVIVMESILCSRLRVSSCSKKCSNSAEHVVYQPMPEMHKQLRPGLHLTPHIAYANVKALQRGDFNNTKNMKQILARVYQSEEMEDQTMHKQMENLHIHISAVVYSDALDSRIGEVGITLHTLYFRYAVDQIVVIEDSAITNAVAMWEIDIDISNIGPDGSWAEDPAYFGHRDGDMDEKQ